MNKDDFYSLGKITKTSGYKGSLMFFFDVDDIQRYRDLESVFLEIDQQLIPFFIEQLRIKSPQKAFVKLQGVDSLEKAQTLVNTEVFLPLTMLPQLSGKDFYHHEVTGFTAVDASFGEIGTIREIQDLKTQSIFVISHRGQEVLIPYHKDFIEKVDRTNKRLHFRTPEGLIELYLDASGEE